jgi:hypothetical protein
MVARISETQGPAASGSEGSPDGSRPTRSDERASAKSPEVGVVKSDGCAVKAVDLTSGDLRRIETEVVRGRPDRSAKSAGTRMSVWCGRGRPRAADLYPDCATMESIEVDIAGKARLWVESFHNPVRLTPFLRHGPPRSPRASQYAGPRGARAPRETFPSHVASRTSVPHPARRRLALGQFRCKHLNGCLIKFLRLFCGSQGRAKRSPANRRVPSAHAKLRPNGP